MGKISNESHDHWFVIEIEWRLELDVNYVKYFHCVGLDMDVHNQQLVFPTVVVCPMLPYETNRTYDLAFSYLG